MSRCRPDKFPDLPLRQPVGRFPGWKASRSAAPDVTGRFPLLYRNWREDQGSSSDPILPLDSGISEIGNTVFVRWKKQYSRCARSSVPHVGNHVSIHCRQIFPVQVLINTQDKSDRTIDVMAMKQFQHNVLGGDPVRKRSPTMPESPQILGVLTLCWKWQPPPPSPLRRTSSLLLNCQHSDGLYARWRVTRLNPIVFFPVIAESLLGEPDGSLRHAGGQYQRPQKLLAGTPEKQMIVCVLEVFLKQVVIDIRF